MTEGFDEAGLARFRARQKSRSRVLGLVLGSLAVLFFAISLVKIAAQAHRHQAPVTSAAKAH